MNTIAGNLELVERWGYRVIDHFVLPEEAWWRDFYDPLEIKISQMRIKYASDAKAVALLGANQAEIDLYRRHSDSSGFVFYVMQ